MSFREARYNGPVRARATTSLVPALLALGCQMQVTEVPLDDLEFDYAFLVSTDEEGEVRRVVGEVGLRNGPGRLPAVRLDSGVSRFFLLTLTEEALLEAVPTFDPERASELELRGTEGRDPPSREVYDEPSNSVRVALPERFGVHAGVVDEQGVLDPASLEPTALDSTRLRSTLLLVVPVLRERCARLGQTGLRPFAATVDTLSDSFGEIGLVDLAWVDDDRILAVGHAVIALLDRGQPFVREDKLPGAPSTPHLWLGLNEVVPALEEREHIAAAALAPTAGPDGRRELLVVGGVAPDPFMGAEPTRGWVRRAWLSEAGLEWADEPQTGLGLFAREVTYLDDGRVMIGGHRGRFWVRETPSASFEPLTPPPPLAVPMDDDVSNIVATGHEDFPIVVGTKGALHLWEVERGRWQTNSIEQQIVLSPEPLKFLGTDTVIEADGGLGIYASTQNGDLIWRPDRLTPWEYPELPYPPRFAQCASATNDDRLLYERRPVNALEVEDGYVHMAYGDCSALVTMKKPDSIEEPLCISLVPVEGEQVLHLSDKMAFREVLASRPNAVAVGTVRGGVYVTEW